MEQNASMMASGAGSGVDSEALIKPVEAGQLHLTRWGAHLGESRTGVPSS